MRSQAPDTTPDTDRTPDDAPRASTTVHAAGSTPALATAQDPAAAPVVATAHASSTNPASTTAPGGPRGPLRALGRGLVILLARLLWGRPNRGPIGAVSKVLVIRTDERVGNVLLTTPLLRALRKGLPDAEIVLLHAASKEALVRGLPHVDRLEPFEKKHFFRRPWAFWAQLRRLRRERFDLVIEAGHYHAFSLTAALLAKVCAPRAIVGHDRGMARWFFHHPVPQPPGVVHDVAVKLSLLGPLGIEPAGFELETPLARDAAALARMEAQLRGDGLDPERLVVINPGARMSVRRWSPAAYGAIARALAERHGAQPLILWGPKERALAEEVLAHAGPEARLAPPTDLAELAALLALARGFVTNDTGPMHLGVACGVPTVAIFLATPPARWGHPLPTFRAVEIDRAGEDAGIERVVEAADGLIFATPGRRIG